MNEFEKLFVELWSSGAIVTGILGLVFRERFISLTKMGFWLWYEKTNFPLFRLQAEHVDSLQMRVITVVVATGLLLAGAYTLVHGL